MIPVALLPYILAGILALLGITGVASYHKGWDSRDTEAKLEQAAAVKKALTGFQNAEKLRIDNQRIADNSSAKLSAANIRAHAVSSDRNRAIDSGALQLSIRARDAGNGLPDVHASGVVSGVAKEARCDIDKEASKRIVAITDDGDDAIRQLNEILDLYHGVKVK